MQPAPFIATFFGITGDLSQHKLIPALYELFCREELPAKFTLIGYGRREFTAESFCDFITAALPNSKRAADFGAHWQYVRGSFADAADFTHLAETIATLDPSDTLNHYFYLAVAPEYYVPLTTLLNGANLFSLQKLNAYLLIEKPYGTDESTATSLTQHLDRMLPEATIFRVDHFLAKQPVRDLPALPAPGTIDHIQISLTEEIGIGNRGAYYDATGVIRDMIQNHGLMLLALLLNRASRHAVLQSLTVTDTITGQYEGYLEESHVVPDSQTETFAAIKLTSSLPEWRDVPIYIRTGKHLAQKITEVAIMLKDTTEPVRMSLLPSDTATEMRSDYANVFFDAFTKQHTFFISDAEIIAAWNVIDPIMATLHSKKPTIYPIGSWGPPESDDLLRRDSRMWLN